MIDYPIRFFNTNIPTNKCNLRCHYCYVGQTYSFNNEHLEMNLEYSFDHMKKSLSLSRLGGVCMFNLCASGETMLYKQLPEIVQMFLELGHYVSIVTNLTLSKPLKQILEIAEKYKDKLFIKCSFQYMELQKLNLIEKFFENVELLKNNGISFTVELTANDESIRYIDDIKQLCMLKLGALTHIIESRNEGEEHYRRLTQLPIDVHKRVWGGFDSPLFAYQQSKWDRKIETFCYAGEYRLSINMADGSVTQCDGGVHLENMFEHPDKKYYFSAIGCNCFYKHCYASHYQSCLCNNFGDDNAPTYAEERDRVCADGSHWLTPVMREVFSHRMSEWHEPYSEDKKLFIDVLMRYQYMQEFPTEEEAKKLVDILEQRFNGKPVGLVQAPEWLVSLFIEAGLKLKFIIDDCGDNPPLGAKQKLKARFRYIYRKIRRDKVVRMKLFDIFPDTEIIICDYINYPRLSRIITERNSKLKITNVVDVIMK